jgi:hypothetical protein
VERNGQYDDDHGGVRQRYAQWKVEKGKEREEEKRRRGEERRRRSESNVTSLIKVGLF